jgi:N-acetyl sugar amidotransferase
MDSSDPEIRFNSEGICSHCLRYDQELPKRVFKGLEAQSKLELLIRRIKEDGKQNEYDCIIGVSGGVDSTYVAYLSKQLGLRPLAIHFDNGWNSELAVSNIEKTLDKLGIDLYTFVINWNEFRDLQLSFLKASTPDGEIPTDHAINALMFKEANKRGIKYILSGMNFSTESISVKKWAYGHSDWKYIKSVHKEFGTKKLKNYPHFTFFDIFWFTYFKGIKSVSILNYIDYNKDQVMNLIQEKLGWVYYGGKHYESVYTRFFQGYILPRKFKIDKRKGHFSDLINSGQLKRVDALSLLNEELYAKQLQIQDKEYVIKKLLLSNNEFEYLMNLPNKTYENYPNNDKIITFIKKIVNYLRLKGFYTK